MSTPSSAIATCIELHLAARPDASLLLVGDTAQRWLGSEELGRARRRHAAAARLDALQGLQRFDLALACGLVCHGRDSVLAHLRDLLASQVLAVEPDEPGVDLDRAALDQTMRALGFTPLARDPDGTCYGHDVGSYKRTPDWLNSRHWANPEQWGRHRW